MNFLVLWKHWNIFYRKKPKNMINFGKFFKKHTPSIFKTITVHLYVRYLYYFRYKNILAKNKELKNQYKRKRCFLIGNGSSLNQMDLTKLKNEYTFVFNFFYLHKDFKEIKPKFYSIMEPIENFPRTDLNADKVFRGVDEAFKNIDVKMFLRIDIKEYIKKNKLFLNKDIYYLLADRGILKTLIMSDDISKYHSFADASLYNAICIAVYLGFNEIYLIGCDYDYILKRNEEHFYDSEIIGQTYCLKNASNLFLAEDMCDYLKIMEKIKNHFRNYNVKIFNAGIGGFTDTFPRVNYDDLFR